MCVPHRPVHIVSTAQASAAGATTSIQCFMGKDRSPTLSLSLSIYIYIIYPSLYELFCFVPFARGAYHTRAARALNGIRAAPSRHCDGNGIRRISCRMQTAARVKGRQVRPIHQCIAFHPIFTTRLGLHSAMHMIIFRSQYTRCHIQYDCIYIHTQHTQHSTHISSG